mmetsp:Transcript_42011/g.90240  ORF Transcript_42011/g.90240 Transcript_42011/m.90240 type:complete len:215 (+) Transcript_42011:397-1041(+)
MPSSLRDPIHARIPYLGPRRWCGGGCRRRGDEGIPIKWKIPLFFVGGGGGGVCDRSAPDLSFFSSFRFQMFVLLFVSLLLLLPPSLLPTAESVCKSEARAGRGRKKQEKRGQEKRQLPRKQAFNNFAPGRSGCRKCCAPHCERRTGWFGFGSLGNLLGVWQEGGGPKPEQYDDVQIRICKIQQGHFFARNKRSGECTRRREVGKFSCMEGEEVS